MRLVYRKSYAVYWSEDGGPTQSVKAELARLHLLFTGSRGARLAVPRDEIESVSYLERHLRIARRDGPDITIGSLDAPGALLELRDLAVG
jgi:hypothetical protein